MKAYVITLFPEVFTYLDTSIIKRARENELISIEYINPRDFTTDKHRTVDDYPYGGGSGMVLKPEPIYDAIESIRGNEKKRIVVMATPQGKVFDQETARKLAQEEEVIFLCGHYEGFDERIREVVDLELSIGDYVLTGGELPVMVMIDAMSRMIPGVIDSDSAACDSFHDNLLDYPHYTRPRNFRDMEAPEVLLSGHHENIRKWRRKESLRKTVERRPDLLKKAELTKEDRKFIREIKAETVSDNNENKGKTD